MRTEEAIPVVDLAGSQTERGRQEAAREIRQACETIGFFAVTGHGVAEQTVATVREEAAAYFALAPATKMQTPQPADRVSRGYTHIGSRGLAYSIGVQTPADLHESFAMGPIEPAPEALTGSPYLRSFFAPNIWPDDRPGLRHAFEAYYCSMTELANRILHLFAVALNLPASHFDRFVDRHTSTMRAIHYPPVSGTPEPGQLRAGEHTDYGTLTIVHGDDVPGGLQVRTRGGNWVDVHPPVDGFVCNIGDLMMRWTNDWWLSNMHRVALPPAGSRKMSRLTMAFFHNPNADALIEPIRNFYRTDEAMKYPVARFGELFLAKHKRTQHMKV